MRHARIEVHGVARLERVLIAARCTLSLDAAQVATTDIPAANGGIHVIDAVILPDGL